MNVIKDINEILKRNNMQAQLNEKDCDKTLKELGVNSLASMTIIVELEEKYGIQIPDDKLMEIKTPNDLIKAINELKK